jgi:hypothetical protein
MRNRIIWATALTLMVLAWDKPWSASAQTGSSGQKGKAEKTMEPSPTAHDGIVFTAEPLFDNRKPLLPEQAPQFRLHLRNEGTVPKTLYSIVGNMYTPSVRLFDAEGHGMGSYTAASRGERAIGDLSGFVPPPPRTVTLAPGKEETSVINLWAHRDPAPPGKYFFDAIHSDGETLYTTNRVPFEIGRGRVHAKASGYDTSERATSILAWLGAPQGSEESRLLVRISGFTSHATAQVGATALGEFDPDASLAVSATPPNSPFAPSLAWVGVISGDRLALIEHSMSEAQWRAPLVSLPISAAIPVPRFPNRSYAVFLATGTGADGPALAGVRAQQEAQPEGTPEAAQEGEGDLKLWVTPLAESARHSACAFSTEGPIAILYSADDGKTSRLHRIDVNEDGSVAAPDQVVRESANEVLAMVADMRIGAPQSFIVLEAERERHDRLALVKIPLAGNLMATALREISGWPTVEGNSEVTGDGDGNWQPAPAQAVAFETDNQGLPWLALTDSEGTLRGGRLDRPLSMVRDGRETPGLAPHIAAIFREVSISAFDTDGALFHYGNAGGY